jgi:5-carboxymethyl-2-hydroxymuconate isomerase
VPHIHLETTANLQENDSIPDILEDLVAILSQQETVGAESIKAYHTLRHTWAMGQGAPLGFVHCTLGLLTDRPLELRQKISAAIGEYLRTRFQDSLSSGEAGLTVELREMERETYIRS